MICQHCKKNDTWTLALLLEGKNIVAFKSVFRIKYKADRSIDKYKAQHVAKGYIQIYGIDYYETFLSVAKLDTLRVLLCLVGVVLCLVANLDWLLHQLI